MRLVQLSSSAEISSLVKVLAFFAVHSHTKKYPLCSAIKAKLLFLFQILSLRFGKDLRVQEIRRLLQSSKPVTVNVVQKPEVR